MLSPLQFLFILESLLNREAQLSYPSSVIIWGKHKALKTSRLDLAKICLIQYLSSTRAKCIKVGEEKK